MTLRLLSALAFASAALLPTPQAQANAVVHWNSVAEAAFVPSQGTNPMAQSRTLAILHASIHDALQSIRPRYASYTPGQKPARSASVDAAVAAASREVLLTLLPEQAAMVNAAYGRALLQVGDGKARADGIALGIAAARATLRQRAQDGADKAAITYAPRSGVGEYQFTAPFNFAAQPGWGHVTPFAIKLKEHQTAGPLAVTSREYADDLAAVKEIGSARSTTRTAEQSEIAKFWYEDSPLGWNRIANEAIRQRGLDEWDAARAFTLLHFAMADGFIAGFKAKYDYRYWRPITAIHAAATDGNDLTEADPAWDAFLVTPPVPDYPSTHTVLGWAAAEALAATLGDRTSFTASSLTLPGVKRSYSSFSQAAEENGQSRLYAGIHFQHAIKDGRTQGRSIGRAVAKALTAIR